MFDNKWQKKEMPLVSLIGMGGGIASPAFLASIVLNILKPTVFSPADDTGVPDFDYTAESSAITNINQIQGGWSSVSFDSNAESGNNQWTATAYGNGKYVALGKTGNAYLVANSTDGINWTSYSTIPYTTYSELAYGNGAFVAVGNGKIVYSTDEGASWSSASVASNWWQGVTYGDGKFVAVSEDGANARVVTSSDGVNWVGIPDTDGSMWQSVTYGGGKFVAVSQMGDVMYSSDGMNWSTTSATESAMWTSVAYGNGKFVAVSGLSTMYSTDGITWTSGNNTVGYWTDITFGDGRFVAVSNYQDSNYPYAAGHSTDGDTWTPSSQAIPNTWNGVDYVNGRFIAVASGVVDGSRMMWSTTGTDEATQLTLTDTTVSKISDGSLVGGSTIDQVLTVGETVQADTAVSSTSTASVFSTTLYQSGSGNEKTITTGIDNTDKSLVWIKSTTLGYHHKLMDSERGSSYPALSSDNTNPETGDAGIKELTSDGFVLHGNGYDKTNDNSNNSYVAWNFRAVPGFFDVVTWTGDASGAGSRTLSHSLNGTVGTVIVKCTSDSSDWMVWHKSLSGGYLNLNEPRITQGPSNTYVSSTNSDFTITYDGSYFNHWNGSGRTYVAYVFADDTPGLIKCGTYTGNGGNQEINLGFETQWLLIKNINIATNWFMVNNMMNDKSVVADETGAEVDNSYGFDGFKATGFAVKSNNANFNASGSNYIYIAIAENAEADVTSDIYATGEVSASTGNTITLSNTSGTWSTGMKIQGTDSDTKDNPDPINAGDVSLTSSAPTAERNVSTWGDAVWEIATDENFTQNVQTATTTLSATGTQAGPSFTLEKDTGYYTRTKYTALGQESEWSDVTYFVTKQNIYVDDVFSTFLYDGNGGTATVNNGIDLSGEGGLLWIKNRSSSHNHVLVDSERSGTNLAGNQTLFVLTSNNSNSELTNVLPTLFTSTGFTTQYSNSSSDDYASWAFRKAPGFFDVVTYTGTGSAQNISHSLGSVPGMIIVKSTTTTQNWTCYHRSYGSGYYIDLNDTNPALTSTNVWGGTDPTSTHFSVGAQPRVNGTGHSYVAYIFAHDDARFGTNSDESIIKCGSYTTTGNGSAVTVDLGFEPQFLLIKSSASNRNWYIFDMMRGINTGQNDNPLYPNTSNAEIGLGYGDFVDLTPTGFIAKGGEVNWFNAVETVTYMAIRRPHKPATVATDVFAIDLDSDSTTIPTWDSGFPVDWSFFTDNSVHGGSTVSATRLLGTNYMFTNKNDPESTDGSLVWDSNVGWGEGYDVNRDRYSYMFRRAPGFFDVVAYTGNGADNHQIPHNLGVLPEFALFKNRDTTDSWIEFNDMNASTYTYGFFNGGDRGTQSYGSGYRMFAQPNATSLFLSDYGSMNQSGQNFICHLFASQPGVSKVGTYSGTGSDINIDCGFDAGARFVMIKRTGGPGDWYVWDSVRGITSGNDPYTTINTTNVAQVTNTDYIDPLNAGFTVTSSAPAAINASGGTYLFLAIA